MKKEPTYNMKLSQINAMKDEAERKGVDKAFKLMLCLPIMAIHDYYDILDKPEGREERFVEKILDLYDSYLRGYVTLQELEECLKEETGIIFEH